MRDNYRNSMTEMSDHYRNRLDLLEAEHDGIKKLVERFEKSMTCYERAFSKLLTEPPRKAGRRSQNNDN